MSKNIILLNAGVIGCRGEFYGMTHRGHTYDADGNIVKLAEPIKRTYPAKNVITTTGFGKIFIQQMPWQLAYDLMVSGTSGSTPVTTDSTMSDIVGKCANGHVSSELLAYNTDPLAGALYRKFRFRRSFSPGRFGATPVNLTRGGIVGSDNGDPSNASLKTLPLYACGLYRDSAGNPTSITVLPDEYFDQIWEYTETFPHDVTGVVSITVDGVPTNFNYTIRLANAFNVGTYDIGWGAVYGNAVQISQVFYNSPRSSLATSSYEPYTQAGYRAGGLVSTSEKITKAPSVNPSSYTYGSPNSAVGQPYALGQNYRDYKMSWSPDRANDPSGVNILQVSFNNGGGAWQVLFDPPLPKAATKQMELVFRLAMANTP